MADTGLQNIKLQDGYVKLLHTKGNDGVNDFVTQVGTSNGPNIVGTPLFLGASGDTENQNPMVKIKAIDSTKPFLVITDSLGTWNAGTDEYPILTFIADGSLTGTDYWGTSLNRGRGVWNGKCMFNFAEGGNRSAIEFMCHSSSDSLTSTGNGTSTFATIRKASSGNNVMFAQPFGTTYNWQFDRVKIAADTGGSAEGSAEAYFDASGVEGIWGDLKADGLYMGVTPSVSSAAGKSVELNITDSMVFSAGGNTTFQNGSNDTFEVYGNKALNLQADGSGDDSITATVRIEAYRKESGAGTSQINIGTDDTESKDFGAGSIAMTGAQSIQIGNPGVVGNSYVNANTTTLASKEVVVGSGMLVLDTAASAWDNYTDAKMDAVADYGALFFQSSGETIDTHSEYGRQLFLYDNDDSSPALYTVEKTQVGKAKVLELRDTTATSTSVETVTNLPASTAQIYMKSGKLIISYDDAGVARYYSIDLTDAAHIAQFDYSASEPA
ncbi:hypothetical protein CMI37_04130 [Candidatus Pacearchaeota archaeon]|nr:hypothetical protein [Candidatus Pacearchaeota archaeon]